MSDQALELEVERLLRRVRGEFVEMPGLQLTEEQAQRLWGLEPGLCAVVLEGLLNAGFLQRSRRGAYRRPSPFATDDWRSHHTL